MAQQTVVFLDFDDTVSDFRLLGEQYVREIAGLLADRFGSESAEWAAAARDELAASVARYALTFVGDPLAGYCAWLGEERDRVASAIFNRMDRPAPEGDLSDFARRTQFEALTRCDALFPGVADAARSLCEGGARVHMASSQESDYLRGALAGTGVDTCVERLFGPDLVDCAKEGPEFYRRVFAACGIRPSQAVVLDDQPMALDWAEEAGARVVQACVRPEPAEPDFPIVLRSFADLPRLVRMGVV